MCDHFCRVVVVVVLVLCFVLPGGEDEGAFGGTSLQMAAKAQRGEGKFGVIDTGVSQEACSH